LKSIWSTMVCTDAPVWLICIPWALHFFSELTNNIDGPTERTCQLNVLVNGYLSFVYIDFKSHWKYTKDLNWKSMRDSLVCKSIANTFIYVWVQFRHWITQASKITNLRTQFVKRCTYICDKKYCWTASRRIQWLNVLRIYRWTR